MTTSDQPLLPEISLSAVIPAYNEENVIESTIPEAIATLRRVVGKFELILVDDASTDRTGELADSLARQYPELVVVHNPQNLRQGGSLMKAFAMARFDLVTHNGMDYPFDFADLPLLLRHFPAADVVVARRRSYPGTTLPRRWVSSVHRGLIRAAFGVPIRDWGFIQVYRRRVLEDQKPFSTATGFLAPERIIRAHRAGYKVVEVDIEYHQRTTGKSSSANRRNVAAALIDMGRLWLEFRQEDLWKPH